VNDGVTGNVTSRRSSPISRDHAHHDQLLVARHAAEDAYAGEEAQARALLETCTDCAALADDIRLLSRATAALPAPRRQRDFRISAEQADSLRGTFFERLLRRLAAPGLAALRPVAGVALSLGIVLAVAGAALPQAASPGALETFREQMSEDSLAPAAPAAASPQAAGAPRNGAAGGEEADGEEPGSKEPGTQTFIEPDEGEVALELAATPDGTDTMRGLMIYGGAAFALVSLGVLLLTWFARRRMHDPLLR